MGSVTVNIRNLKGVTAALGTLSANPSAPAFEAMFNQWAKRYEVFIKRRYDRNASGQGDWAPLALSTIKARTAAKKGGKNAFTKKSGRRSERSFLARDTRRGTLVASPRSYQILKDTGTLFGSLTIGNPANAVTRAPGSITYSIGRGKLGTVASAHQFGNPAKGLPARPILVQPDAQTLRGIKTDAENAVRKIIAEAK
jgi:hypothetical protein